MTGSKPPDDRLYSVSDVAEELRVTRKTVLSWISSGQLPASRTPGGHWRITASVVAKVRAGEPLTPVVEPVRLLTPADVARRLGVGHRTVLRWISEGTLPAMKTPGGRWRVHSEVVDAVHTSSGQPDDSVDPPPRPDRD